MRTEREVRRKLSKVRYELKRYAKKGSFWGVLRYQVDESILLWVLKRRP